VITSDTEFLKRTAIANKVMAFMVEWAWDIFDLAAATSALDHDDPDFVLDY